MKAGNQPASLFHPFLNSFGTILHQLAKKEVFSALICRFQKEKRRLRQLKLFLVTELLDFKRSLMIWDACVKGKQRKQILCNPSY